MTEKKVFIQELKDGTKKMAVDIIRSCNNLEKCHTSDVVIYQFVKTCTSAAANYQAARRAQSQAEFFSKICIVVEESDETEFWLELIKDSALSDNQYLLGHLLSKQMK